jgi:hypothetical protein
MGFEGRFITSKENLKKLTLVSFLFKFQIFKIKSIIFGIFKNPVLFFESPKAQIIHFFRKKPITSLIHKIDCLLERAR